MKRTLLIVLLTILIFLVSAFTIGALTLNKCIHNTAGSLAGLGCIIIGPFYGFVGGIIVSIISLIVLFKLFK